MSWCKIYPLIKIDRFYTIKSVSTLFIMLETCRQLAVGNKPSLSCRSVTTDRKAAHDFVRQLMFCLFSHDSCLLLSKHRINWLHVITISEERLTRQQRKSDVKQKGVYDRGRRDAACYLFTIIKMESCESRRAIPLPSSAVCTAMKCYMSARRARWCRLCLYPLDGLVPTARIRRVNPAPSSPSLFLAGEPSVDHSSGWQDLTFKTHVLSR